MHDLTPDRYRDLKHKVDSAPRRAFTLDFANVSASRPILAGCTGLAFWCHWWAVHDLFITESRKPVGHDVPGLLPSSIFPSRVSSISEREDHFITALHWFAELANNAGTHFAETFPLYAESLSNIIFALTIPLDPDDEEENKARSDLILTLMALHIFAFKPLKGKASPRQILGSLWKSDEEEDSNWLELYEALEHTIVKADELEEAGKLEELNEFIDGCPSEIGRAVVIGNSLAPFLGSATSCLAAEYFKEGMLYGWKRLEETKPIGEIVVFLPPPTKLLNPLAEERLEIIEEHQDENPQDGNPMQGMGRIIEVVGLEAAACISYMETLSAVSRLMRLLSFLNGVRTKKPDGENRE